MTDVSRETEALEQRYADNPGLVEYTRILSTTGVERGLIGPREIPRMWPRHVANCAVVAEEDWAHLPRGARVADVGSGAGLPGLVWALVRPDLSVWLIEPLLRRATFLEQVVSDLGLTDRVVVLRSRAEEVRQTFDVVTARAVARLPQLLAWTAPLTSPGGWVLALKGANVTDEISDTAQSLERLGCGQPLVAVYGRDVLTQPTTVVLVPKLTGGIAARHR